MYDAENARPWDTLTRSIPSLIFETLQKTWSCDRKVLVLEVCEKYGQYPEYCHEAVNETKTHCHVNIQQTG